METKVGFWQKYQVLIASVASALVIFLQQAIIAPEIDWKAIGLGAATIAAGIVGNELRGKGLSITGIISAVAISFHELQTTGNLSLDRLILSIALQIGMLALPPFKSIGYEYAEEIKRAKIQGEADVPTPLASNKIKEKAEALQARQIKAAKK